MNKNYRKVILDNGITLLVHGDKTMKKIFVSFTVKYGSSGQFFKFNYDEKEYNVLPGCAHFLEHMLGEHSQYGDLYNLFHSYKYSNNAYTSLDRTKYYFSGTCKIKSSIKKLIYSIEKPVFNKKDVKETSNAIVEETKMGLDDSYFKADLLSLRNLYANVDLVDKSLSAIGDEETTKKLDYDMLKLCYDAFYYDENKIIVVAGNIDEDDIINYIKGIYKNIKRHENKTKLYIPEDITKIRKENDILRRYVEDDYLIIDYNNFIEGFSRFEVSNFIRYIGITYFSNKSKFYERLKSEGILLAYDGYDYNFTLVDGAITYGFRFFVRNYKKFLEEFYKEIKSIKFNKDDFELFKKASISDIISREDDKYGYYIYLSDSVVFYNEELDELEETKKLSFDRLVEFYNKFDLNNRVITLLTKEGYNG